MTRRSTVPRMTKEQQEDALFLLALCLARLSEDRHRDKTYSSLCESIDEFILGVNSGAEDLTQQQEEFEVEGLL